MTDKQRRISYFTLFSWLLVALFYVWCLGQIWTLRDNFGSTDTWELANFAYRAAVIVFLLVLSGMFTVSYVIFIRWLNNNYVDLEDKKAEEPGEMIDNERL